MFFLTYLQYLNKKGRANKAGFDFMFFYISGKSSVK